MTAEQFVVQPDDGKPGGRSQTGRCVSHAECDEKMSERSDSTSVRTVSKTSER